jgi:hypothetical protein
MFLSTEKLKRRPVKANLRLFCVVANYFILFVLIKMYYQQIVHPKVKTAFRKTRLENILV